MRAFHGNAAVKTEYLARLSAHEVADEIIHGTYWQNGKGCAVGCTVHLNDNAHAAYESQLGIPQVIARLEDRIFEGMKNGDSKTFPRRFLEAIPVGADLSLVWPRFAVWLLVDEEHGVRRHTKRDSAQWVAISRVAELYAQTINGEKVTIDEWREARVAAEAAAEAAEAATYASVPAEAAAVAVVAAYTDAGTAPTYATSAIVADAVAAVDAADAVYAEDDAAVAYAAADAARGNSFERQSEKFIELLSAAPSSSQLKRIHDASV